MSIDQLYELVEKSGSETSFNRGEVEAMYIFGSTLPPGSVLVEIGVEYGRSTTVLGVLAKEQEHEFWAIDSWMQDNSAEARAHIERVLLGELELPIRLIKGDSAKIPFKQGVDLLHVDGDHTVEGVSRDLEAWLPRVSTGGVVLFDDYGHDSLPGVYEACTQYMTPEQYRFLGRWGNKLGVFLKV